MFWTFVAMAFSGLGAAGIALGIRAITRNRAPKWLIPVFAGVGMLAYLIQGEYTWYEHKKSLLPDEAIVVGTEKKELLWRPWTFVIPQVTAFTVLDTDSVVTENGDDRIMRFNLYKFEQSYADHVEHRMHLLNCAAGELVPLGDEGQPHVDQMRKLAEGDRLHEAVCR